METYDWDQTITVEGHDDVAPLPEATVAVTADDSKKKIQGTINFKSASTTRDQSHAANISAKECADDAEFKLFVCIMLNGTSAL